VIEITDYRAIYDFTLLNGCTGKCVRLSRLLAFECTLNHRTFISFREMDWRDAGQDTKIQRWLSIIFVYGFVTALRYELELSQNSEKITCKARFIN